MISGAKGGILEQYYNAKLKVDDGANLKSPKQPLRAFNAALNSSLFGSTMVEVIPEEDPLTNRESIRGIQQMQEREKERKTQLSTPSTYLVSN